MLWIVVSLAFVCTNVDTPKDQYIVHDFSGGEKSLIQTNTLSQTNRSLQGINQWRKTCDGEAAGGREVSPKILNDESIPSTLQNKSNIDKSRVIEWIRQCESPVVNLIDDGVKISGVSSHEFSDDRMCNNHFNSTG